jgi:hypothetical protein
MNNFSKSNGADFQIVCIDCGCLAIRIEDPVKASREAIVHCGDCGASRGTLGALRDLAVQPNTDAILSAKSVMSRKDGSPLDDPQSCGDISKRYGELRRLRRQVEIAETLARHSGRRLTVMSRTRRGSATLAP